MHINIDLVYPVGSIYMSAILTNPSLLFGGSWTQLKDRFLLGAGDTYLEGATGGSATHTLTISEMPSHRHSMTIPTGTSVGTYNNVCKTSNYSDMWNLNDRMSNAGGDQPHNNMPPYLVVYMWERIA